MSEPTEILSGQRALITGATSGIGEAIACALARQGVDLVLLGRNRNKLDGLAARLARTEGVTVDTKELDLALDISSEIDRLVAKIGSLNLLIHSAGVLVSESSFDESRITDFDLQYRVNLRSPYLITRGFLPALRAAQGQIVFINSSAAQQKTKVGAFSYTVMKYGLSALADGLRDQVNAEGIRVVSVYPGKTATSMQQKIYLAQKREFKGERMLQAEDVAQTMLATLVLPRTAEVTDISVRPFLKE